MEALHDNSLPFINGGEGITAVPHIPIWLSLTIILGVLVIATVASLLKTRGEPVEVDEPVVDPETAKSVPTGGPEAAAAAEARIAEESDEERSRR
jgi:tellurite resistance protein TerC